MTAISALVVAFAIAATSGTAVTEGPIPAELSIGDRGPWVEQLNDQLEQAGFHPDDGRRFGKRTRHAVYAFQKHHGLPTTGRFTAFMWHLLERPLELPKRAEPQRVEVDLGRQVLYVVRDHEVALVVPISSGNEANYITEQGTIAKARTPEGRFRFQRVINGMREAFLGQMYNPYYFWGGYAIHGSPSVPNYPASHGCIRVTMWDMDLLLDYFRVGMPVYIYGRRQGPPPPAPRYTPPRFV